MASFDIFKRVKKITKTLSNLMFRLQLNKIKTYNAKNVGKYNFL